MLFVFNVSTFSARKRRFYPNFFWQVQWMGESSAGASKTHVDIKRSAESRIFFHCIFLQPRESRMWKFEVWYRWISDQRLSLNELVKKQQSGLPTQLEHLFHFRDFECSHGGIWDWMAQDWWDSSAEAGPKTRPQASYSQAAPSLQVLTVSQGKVKCLGLMPIMSLEIKQWH